MLKINLLRLEPEEWRPVPMMPSVSASSRGRVKFGDRLRPLYEDGHGYPIFYLPRHGNKSVHQAVAKAFLGQPPEGMEVNHKDGNPANNTPGNLEYVTHSDNLRHSHRVLGQHSPSGEEHTSCKISDRDVVAARSRYANGETNMSALAREYGITPQQMRMIIYRVYRKNPTNG